MFCTDKHYLKLSSENVKSSQMFFYLLLVRTFYSTSQQCLTWLSVAVKTESIIHCLGAAHLMREMCSADQFSFFCAAPAELQFRLCQRSNV